MDWRGVAAVCASFPSVEIDAAVAKPRVASEGGLDPS